MSTWAERVRFRISVGVSFAGALIFHLVIGWPFTVVGTAIGGWLGAGRGLVAGFVGGSASWAALALWSRTVDAPAVDEMLRVVGQIVGGAPAWVILVATILLGGIIGAAGGWTGQALRNLLRPVRR